MKIGDLVYHPCSLDILKFKVISVFDYGSHKQYELKATDNIGACGRVNVLVNEDSKGNLSFVELISHNEFNNGLGEFVEGSYFKKEKEAKLAFYKIHETLARTKMSEAERFYNQAKESYERVKSIINTIVKETE